MEAETNRWSQKPRASADSTGTKPTMKKKERKNRKKKQTNKETEQKKEWARATSRERGGVGEGASGSKSLFVVRLGSTDCE